MGYRSEVALTLKKEDLYLLIIQEGFQDQL